MKSIVPRTVLFPLLWIALCMGSSLGMTRAHVEMLYRTLPVNQDMVLQMMIVPHGCLGWGPIPTHTTGLTLFFPSTVPYVMAQEVAHFTSTLTRHSDLSSTLVYTADTNYSLPGNYDHFQLFGFLSILDSTLTDGTVIYVPVNQTCTGQTFFSYVQTPGHLDASASHETAAPSFVAFVPPGDSPAALYGSVTSVDLAQSIRSIPLPDHSYRFAMYASVVAMVLASVSCILMYFMTKQWNKFHRNMDRLRPYATDSASDPLSSTRDSSKIKALQLESDVDLK